MRLIVEKPVDGKVTIRLEDRRGMSGMREIRRGVPIDEVEATVAPLVAAWRKRRRAVYAVRSGKQG